ncbi:MAG: BACON domain-containing protein [Carboxylicivirga sp.]|jgi:YD repeat-containing protein|nr:BACON domain-containing protein [Carboxylicivirga sp.]
MNKLLFTLGICLVQTMLVLGQDPIDPIDQAASQNLQDYTPPSPEALAFKKYGDYPVTHYTGLPGISIPIHTIEVDGVQIPISLDYHASGIKVNESASWVGLGWTLKASGVLSRQVNGIPDEAPTGYLNNDIYPQTLTDPLHYEGMSGTSNELTYLMNVAEGSRDSESDDYSINFAGINSKFVFDKEGNIQHLPHSNLKVIRKGDDNWMVKDTRGIVYYFTRPETIQHVKVLAASEPGSNPSEQTFSPGSVDMRLGRKTGWYITKLVTPNGQEINFHYGGFSRTLSVSTSESAAIISNALINKYPTDKYYSYSQTEIKHNVPLLSKITYPNGEVIFKPKTDARDDIPETAYALDKIEINDINSNTFKTFRFNHDYFQSQSINGNNSTFSFKRLKLISVQEIGKDGMSTPPYVFNYDDDQNFPYLYSLAQDHWGYFNGAYGNENGYYKFIPSKSYLETYNSINYQYEGANRQPKFPEMKAWTLEKIKYPTGGYTEFEYEPHNYFAPSGSSFNEQFKTITQSYENSSVTEGNDLLLNTSCIHEFNVPGINGKTATANLEMTFANSAAGHNSHKVYIRPKGQTNKIFNYEYDGEATTISGETANLVSGTTYELVMENNLAEPDFVNLNLKYKVYVNNSSEGNNLITGGLRIKKIISNNGEEAISRVQEFKYTQENSTNSSARLDLEFKYFLDFISNIELPSSSPTQYMRCNSSGEILQPASEVFYSNSLNGLGITQGASVGYRRVEVINGFKESNSLIQNKGKEVYYYTTRDQSSQYIFPDFMYGYYSYEVIPPPGSWGTHEYLGTVFKSMMAWKPYNFFPFFPDIRKSWEEGLLSYKEIINSNGDIISTKAYHRTFAVDHKRISKGLKVQGISYSLANSFNLNKYIHLKDNAVYQRYFIESDRVRLDSIVDVKIENGQHFKTTNSYTFDDQYFLLTSKRTKGSDGEEILTSYQYPFNYSDELSQEMVTNRFLLPLQSVTEKNNTIISGVKFAYNRGNYVDDLERNIYLKTKTNINARGQWISKVIADKHSDSGKILQQRLQNNIMHSYIWSYNDQYPIIQAQNISHDDLLSAVNAVILQHFPSKTLDTFISSLADMTTSSQRNDWDEFNEALRNHPLTTNAMISSYTFIPLNGISSQSDPNGVTTYYEYDGFGRFKLAADNNRDITQSVAYNYQQALSVDVSNLSFNDALSSKTISLKAFVPWTVAEKPSWIAVSPSNGSSNATLTITASANSSTSNRNGSIVIEGSNEENEHIKAVINVNQDGKTQSNYLTVSPNSFENLDTPKNITVSSDLCWTVTLDQMGTPWVLVKNSSGNVISNGCFNMTLKLEADPNVPFMQRSPCNVIISSGGITRTITIDAL